MRHGRFGHADHGGNIAYTQLPPRKSKTDLQPGLIPQHFEGLAEALENRRQRKGLPGLFGTVSIHEGVFPFSCHRFCRHTYSHQ